MNKEQEMTSYQKSAENEMCLVLAHFLSDDPRFGRAMGDVRLKLHRDDFEILRELIQIMPNFEEMTASLIIASLALELIELRKSLPLYEGKNIYQRPKRLGEVLMQDAGDLK